MRPTVLTVKSMLTGAGPAKYLASMIPRNASRQSPSTAVLAGILQRAGLRLGVVSLACCVLDCLSDRFLRQWRRLCLGHDSCPERSELLAICALAVSMKFMEDSVRLSTLPPSLSLCLLRLTAVVAIFGWDMDARHL